MVWGGLEVVWWWFGANMAGQRNKNAFKFLLQLLILSQKHILGVKKVVWDGLDVVWGGLEVVWGVSTDPPAIHSANKSQVRIVYTPYYFSAVSGFENIAKSVFIL